MNKRLYPLAICISLLASIGNYASAQSQIEDQQVVELKAIELPNLVGNSFAKITLLAVKDGILIPVPHQLEDFDEQGESWFKESKTPLLGTEGIIDPHDSLLFRYVDMGQRLDAYNAEFTKLYTEIQVLSSHTNEVRYLYVSRHLEGFHYKPLTQYDQKAGIIKSDYFTLRTNPKDFLSWNDFTYSSYEGKQQSSLLDTLKLRITAGILFNTASVTLDNNDINTEVLAVKQGPIRTTILAKSQFTFASVPVVYLDIRFKVLPQQFNISVDIHVPSIIATLLSNPKATLSIDGNNLLNSEVLSSFNPILPTKVDGKMSSSELALLHKVISEDRTWVMLSTNEGFDIYTELYVPSNFDAPISLLYVDNFELAELPERFTGQGPNIGYSLREIPLDETFKFQFDAYFADKIGNPYEFASRIKDIPAVASQTINEEFTLVQGENTPQ
ncbi:hypothetical protein A9Q99_12615 [Gammaproteobacteria bacterium 45_16_T64]|nr:hypothetical protein A9Q99_12615 [Gammaproteobacteria bacterium 45_16_T64]